MMTIVKNIVPFRHMPQAIMCYSEDQHDKADSGVKLYTMQKLSILLTDDLAAVIGNKVYNTVRGDFFVFSPDEIHHGRFLRSGLHRYLDFYFPMDYFESDALRPGCAGEPDIMTPFKDRNGRVNLVHSGDRERMQLIALSEQAAALAAKHPDSEDHTADIQLFALMIDIMALCTQAYIAQKMHPAVLCVPAVISKAIGFINEHYAAGVSLKEIAAACGCSVTYLTREFRRHTGRTPYAYLTERRISAAEGLLREGATVTEACYGAGFGDCTNFIRVFRKYEGVTPGQYRLRI